MKRVKPMCPVQWRAAVDLLMMELRTAHILFAQLYNDPSNIEFTRTIPKAVEFNRMIMKSVETRIGRQGLHAPRKKKGTRT